MTQMTPEEMAEAERELAQARKPNRDGTASQVIPQTQTLDSITWEMIAERGGFTES